MDQKQLLTFVALTNLLKLDHNISLAEILNKEQLQLFIKHLEANKDILEKKVSGQILIELIEDFADEHLV